LQSGNFPAFTQVICYQRMGLRMGASFMLGFVQALMGADESYRVFPAVAAIPIVIGALAVAAAAFSVCRRWLPSVLCGATLGLTLNGMTYAASNGFLPQVWGLGFACASLAMIGPLLRQAVEARSSANLLRQWAPAALVLSAAMHCYSELSPFLVASLGMVFVAALAMTQGRRGRLLAVSLWAGLLVACLINLELIRIIRAIRTQAGVVVGMAVDWPWWHFPGLAMGLRTGAHDVNFYLLTKAVMGIACLAGLGLMFAGLAWSCRTRREIWRPMPHLAFLGLITVAFVYFRWVAPSPWPIGKGQSWNQFKLGNWATPSIFCLMSAGVGALARKSAARSCIVTAGLLGVVVIGAIRHAQLAGPRTEAIRQDTGLSYDPFAAFFAIRQFSGAVPPEEPIDLSVTPGKIGLRQWIMYALMDHRVAGDWSDDSWVKYWLQPGQLTPSVRDCRWIVSTDPHFPSAARHAGNLWFGPRPRALFVLRSVSGGYPREADGAGWWHWTDKKLAFTYQLVGESPRRIRISFQYMPVSDHRPIHVDVGGKKLDVFLDLGEHAWTSPPIEVGDIRDRLTVGFDCDLPPVRLSPGDPRIASYLIKNLAVFLADP
jgi:hypothetical protein